LPKIFFNNQKIKQMNQHFFKISNIAKSLFLSGLMVILSLSVFAKNKKQDLQAASTQPNVQAIATSESSTLVSVQFDTENPVKFDVIIRDESGNLLYRKNYESSNFSKQFQLVNETGDNSTAVSFSIQVAGGQEFHFTVNSTVDVVKEIAISKL